MLKSLNEGKEEIVSCALCNGSGAVIDNKIPEILKRYFPTMSRSLIPKIMLEIYEHVDAKLVDSYERGKKDAEFEKLSTPEVSKEL